MKFGKTVFLVLATLVSVPAFAKITIYSKQDALLALLQSPEFANTVKGELESVSITTEGSPAKALFSFHLSYITQGPVGETPCEVTATIATELYKPIPGVTASRLAAPVFEVAACAP